MATGPDSAFWSLEHLSRQLTGTLRKPLDEYHPLVLDAVLNHLPDALKRESIRRAQVDDDAAEAEWERTRDTGGVDPEWDELEQALRAGIDPATLPSWQGGSS